MTRPEAEAKLAALTAKCGPLQTGMLAVGTRPPGWCRYLLRDLALSILAGSAAGYVIANLLLWVL